MPTDSQDNRFLIGLLVGAGVGLAAALLLTPKGGSRNRELLVEGAKSLTDLTSERRGPTIWRQGKTERAGRKLRNRIERIRSAGL